MVMSLDSRLLQVGDISLLSELRGDAPPDEDARLLPREPTLGALTLSRSLGVERRPGSSAPSGGRRSLRSRAIHSLVPVKSVQACRGRKSDWLQPT